jgi:hypothetical protein
MDSATPAPRQALFAIGARVWVSASCAGWRSDSLGTVVDMPEAVQTVRGEDHFYWVRFDSPQHDLSDDGPYDRAQVLGCCLTRAL